MNIRLMYNFEFLGGIFYQDQLQLNSYRVHLNLLTQTEDAVSSHIALERIKSFVQNELSSSIFFGPQDHDKAEMFHVMGANVTTLPEEPVDQIVGIMLYCKFNAIMEDRVVVTGLDISSTLGDSTWYALEEDDPIGPFAQSQDCWWHKSNTQHHDLDIELVPNKVVRVIPSDWHEYELQWPEEYVETNNNTVLYPNFRRHETK
jgi:hypothetical protein